MKRIKKDNPKEKKMRSLRRIQQGDVQEKDNTFRKEIEILKSCNHPNIVRLLEAIDDPHIDVKKVYLCAYLLFFSEDLLRLYSQSFTSSQSKKILQVVLYGKLVVEATMDLI
jgi:serine/threonine protein kinase